MSRSQRVVCLIERRSRVVRLRREDVTQLIASHSRVIEVVPTVRRGIYKLTARGFVGCIQTASCRYILVPKIPITVLANWVPNVQTVASTDPSAAASGWFNGLTELIAERLRLLMETRLTAGLVRDYVEHETESATIRGRIDWPRQLRDTIPRAEFHLVSDDHTADVIWNQLPVHAANRLLASTKLSTDARSRLEAVVQAFPSVTRIERTGPLLWNLRYTPRTEPYRELIELCQCILSETGSDSHRGTFLLNLERLFQTELTRQLQRPGMLPRHGTAIAEPELALHASRAATLSVWPDLLIANQNHEPISMWDVKWKTLRSDGPNADDVHQVLSYAALTGTTRAGLIYPGRRFTSTVYQRPGLPMQLRVVRLPVSGSIAKWERAIRRLGRQMSLENAADSSEGI